jgi:hypothetical protein
MHGTMNLKSCYSSWNKCTGFRRIKFCPSSFTALVINFLLMNYTWSVFWSARYLLSYWDRDTGRWIPAVHEYTGMTIIERSTYTRMRDGCHNYSCSWTGPGAYAPDAPQPIGFLCNPEHLPRFRRSYFHCQAPPLPGASTARRLHVHMMQETLAAKGGIVGENVGR